MHDSEIYIIMGVEKIWKLQVFTLPSYLSNANHETFLGKKKRANQWKNMGLEFESL